MKEATFTRGSRKTTAFGDKQGRESDRLFRTLYTASGGNMSPPSPFFSPSPLPLPSSTEYKLLCTVYRCSASIPCMPSVVVDLYCFAKRKSIYHPLRPPSSSSSVRKLDTPLFDSLSPSPPPLPPPFTNDKSMLTTWRKGKEGGCIRRGIEQRRRSPLTGDLQIPLFRISTLPCSTGEKFWLHRRSDICGKTLAARVEWRTPRSFHLHR